MIMYWMGIVPSLLARNRDPSVFVECLMCDTKSAVLWARCVALSWVHLVGATARTFPSDNDLVGEYIFPVYSGLHRGLSSLSNHFV